MESTEIFTRTQPVRGIISIRNLRDDRIYLKTTEDAVRSFSDERFRLDLGMHEATELQSDYSSIGLELFSIDLDKEALPAESLPALLEERKAFWKGRGFILYRGPAG